MSTNENNTEKKIKFDPSAQKRKSKKEPAIEYKTEAQLKEETARRMEDERLMEAARKPQSPVAKKADNFMYHYKRQLIGGAVALALLIFFLQDVVFTVKPDLTILTLSRHSIPQSARESMEEYLSSVVPDINGDGKTVVVLDVVTVPEDALSAKYRVPMPGDTNPEFMPITGDPEMDMANIMKIMAVFSARTDPLVMMDEAAYDYMLYTMVDRDSNGIPLEPVDVLAVQSIPAFTLLEDFEGYNPYSFDIISADIPQDLYGLAAFENMSFYLRDWDENSKNKGKLERGREFLDILAGR